jgi:hypothetical protein
MLATVISFMARSRLQHSRFMRGVFQRKAEADRTARIANQERTRRLKAEHGNEIDIFNTHDAVDDARCCDIR